MKNVRNFRIASWNVNSLKVRLPHVLDWLADAQPDVLGLQELKMPTEHFPEDAFREMGYQSIVNGQKTWNGVAFLTRFPGTQVITGFPHSDDPQKRLLAATIQDVRILNLYIPNGESIESDKYQYKLAWLNKLHAFVENEQKHFSKIVLLGDFNIAPAPEDVHDPAKWEGHVLCSKPERQAFQSLLNLGLVDCFRSHFTEGNTPYSWWDYRMNAFKRNIGLRIDHILANTQLSTQCRACYIDKKPRGAERPSDHAPIVADFAEE